MINLIDYGNSLIIHLNAWPYQLFDGTRLSKKRISFLPQNRYNKLVAQTFVNLQLTKKGLIKNLFKKKHNG